MQYFDDIIAARSATGNANYVKHNISMQFRAALDLSLDPALPAKLASVPVFFADAVEGFSAASGGDGDHDDSACVVMHLEDRPEVRSDPAVTVAPLRREHADFVLSTWKFSFPEARRHLEEIIALGLCYGVFDKGKIVACACRQG